MIPRNVLGVGGGGGSFPLAGNNVVEYFVNRSTSIINGFNFVYFGTSTTNHDCTPIVVPEIWDSSKDPAMFYFGFQDDDDAGKTIRFRYLLASKDDLDTRGTYEMDVVEDFDAVDNADEAFHYEFTTKVDKTLLHPGKVLGLRAQRNSSHPNDNRSGNFRFVCAYIKFPIKES